MILLWLADVRYSRGYRATAFKMNDIDNEMGNLHSLIDVSGAE